MSDVGRDKSLLWAWAQRHFARIAELKREIRDIDKEYSKLLEARQNVLTDIESLEERVRPMVQAALALELPMKNELDNWQLRSGHDFPRRNAGLEPLSRKVLDLLSSQGKNETQI